LDPALAVCTRNPVACIFGSVLFWLVCFGMNYVRVASPTCPNSQWFAAAATSGPSCRITSLVFGLGMLGAAGRHLATTDY
jgi:hypothetical protein